MEPTARFLPDGKRLHLQHGPIDLVIGAEGERRRAFRAARSRFQTVLEELLAELPALRRPVTPDVPLPEGAVAKRMHAAVWPHSALFVTRMASVAGAVADEILAAMQARSKLTRAYVNNGGDIALYLSPGTNFKLAMRDHLGRDLGVVKVSDKDKIGGVATSGRYGRSLSMGIADSVTTLARNAAEADAAATLIANAVDLPDHPAISRQPAREVSDDTDLDERPVVTSCDALSAKDCAAALCRGHARAAIFKSRSLIAEAGLFLQGHSRTTCERLFEPAINEACYE